MKARVFTSVEAVMKAYFPEQVEKERRAALTDEEYFRELGKEMAERLVKKFRARLVREE